MKSKKWSLVGKRCLAVLLALCLTCAGIVINQGQEAKAEEATTATVTNGRFYTIDAEPLEWEYKADSSCWASSRIGNGYVGIWSVSAGNMTISPGTNYAVSVTFTAPEDATISPVDSGKSVSVYRSHAGKGDKARIAVYLNNTKLYPTDGLWADISEDSSAPTTFGIESFDMKKGDQLRYIIECGGNGSNSYDSVKLTAMANYYSYANDTTTKYVKFTEECCYTNAEDGGADTESRIPGYTKKEIISYESVSITENTLTGTTFTEHKDNPFKTAKGYRTEILTYEATVKFPADFTGAGGTVIGNRGWGGDTYSLDINESGNVSLYLNDINTSGGSYTYTFADTNVYTGKWVHIAVVRDKANKTVTCYIDGRQAGVITADNAALNIVPIKVECVGGDLTEANTHCFQGSIYDVLLYSDMRTDREILLDVGKVDEDNEHLIAHYNFDAVTSDTTTVQDQNGKESPYIYPVYK